MRSRKIRRFIALAALAALALPLGARGQFRPQGGYVSKLVYGPTNIGDVADTAVRPTASVFAQGARFVSYHFISNNAKQCSLTTIQVAHNDTTFGGFDQPGAFTVVAGRVVDLDLNSGGRYAVFGIVDSVRNAIAIPIPHRHVRLQFTTKTNTTSGGQLDSLRITATVWW